MDPFIPGKMINYCPGDSYDSPARPPLTLMERLCTTPIFYYRIMLVATRWLVGEARKGRADDATWVYGSSWAMEEAEKTGLRLHIEGLDILNNMKTPCVICANHMSTLETFFLPAIVQPRLPVTFVVKNSLVKGNLFGALMRSRDPVVLDRKNPREDLMKLMEEGKKRLDRGISIIVFPQATRRRYFSPVQFNTIGEKLAKKAGVPLVPLALKTNAWGLGPAPFKDFGPVRPNIDVLFKFFPPITITKSGHTEHQAILKTLQHTLDYWEKRQNAIDQGYSPAPFNPEDFSGSFRNP